MIIRTDHSKLNDYKNFLDKNNEAENFRLYYEDKQTNLIYYQGKIIYLPKKFFELKNLINVDQNQRIKCSVSGSEIKLIRELEAKKIPFFLEDNLNELVHGELSLSNYILDMMGDSVQLEMISDYDYTKLNQPIYLGNGLWMNYMKHNYKNEKLNDGMSPLN